MPEILVFSGPALPLLDMANSMKPDDWNLHIRTSESSEAEIAQAAEIADFILVFGHGVSDDVLRLAKKTKLVQLCSAGFDGINLGLAGELGIPVANNGGANAIPVAEFAITLALSTIRHLIITVLSLSQLVLQLKMMDLLHCPPSIWFVSQLERD